MSTIDNSDTTNDVNLDDFSAEFFGQSKVETADSEATEEVEEIQDDTSDSDASLEEQETDTHDSDDGDDTPATEEDDESEDSDEEQEEPAHKPKKNRFQERINELTGKVRSGERENADLKARLEQLEKQLKPEPASSPETKLAVDNEPDPNAKNDDGTDKYPLGEFDPKYQADLVRHLMKAEREAFLKEAETERTQKAQQEAAQALQAEWNTKLEPAQERYPDFIEKATSFVDDFSDLDPAYGDYLGNVIKSMEYGPDVLYYLATNPDEAKQIVASGAQKATIALGRIESRFIRGEEIEPTPTPVRTTKAPEPPKNFNKGTSVSKGTVAPDTDDLDAFVSEFFKKKRG